MNAVMEAKLPLSGKGVLVFGDLHLEENSIEECIGVLAEIADTAKKYDCDKLIQLGDLSERNHLTARELFVLTKEMVSLGKRFCLNVIEGNHTKHSKDISVINYLKYCSVNVFGEEVLFNTEFGKVLCGHWFVDKSHWAKYNYKFTTKELEKIKYDYGFLGHQHNPQKVTKKLWHLGSVRYVDFGELNDNQKQVAIINKNGLKFVPMKRIIPMKQVSDLGELKKIESKTKVRYVFNSFAQLKNELNQVHKEGKRFFMFKKKLDFDSPVETSKQPQPTAKTPIKDFVDNWLSNIEDKEVKSALEVEFVEEL